MQMPPRHVVVRYLCLLFLIVWLWWSLFGVEKIPDPSGDNQVRRVSAQPTPPKECPKVNFTVAEVLKHSSCKFNLGEFDLWLAINGSIYEVSEFAPRHPGGMMICEGAGVDATAAFAHFHRPWVSERVLRPWCVGYLKEGETMPKKTYPRKN